MVLRMMFGKTFHDLPLEEIEWLWEKCEDILTLPIPETTEFKGRVHKITVTYNTNVTKGEFECF